MDPNNALGSGFYFLFYKPNPKRVIRIILKLGSDLSFL